MFYAISYALMAAAAFGAIILLSRRGFDADEIDDFRGPVGDAIRAALPGAVRHGLAGRRAAVPGLLGQAGGASCAALQGGMTWLAIWAVVCAVIGAFYYLR